MPVFQGSVSRKRTVDRPHTSIPSMCTRVVRLLRRTRNVCSGSSTNFMIKRTSDKTTGTLLTGMCIAVTSNTVTNMPVIIGKKSPGIFRPRPVARVTGAITNCRKFSPTGCCTLTHSGT